MSQVYTFIDPGGNRAQYTVYDADQRSKFYWTTDHGDNGLDVSFAEAQMQARTALKASMAERRRASQRYP